MGTERRTRRRGTYGDILAFHGGRNVVIDITFSSVKTASQGEKDKVKDYQKKLIYPERSFVPMGVDCNGEWGPSMEQYLEEAKRSLESSEVGDKRNWRFTIQRISLGICKANYEYIRRIRKGTIIKEKSKRKVRKSDAVVLAANNTDENELSILTNV